MIFDLDPTILRKRECQFIFAGFHQSARSTGFGACFAACSTAPRSVGAVLFIRATRGAPVVALPTPTEQLRRYDLCIDSNQARHRVRSFGRRLRRSGSLRASVPETSGHTLQHDNDATNDQRDSPGQHGQGFCIISATPPLAGAIVLNRTVCSPPVCPSAESKALAMESGSRTNNFA